MRHKPHKGIELDLIFACKKHPGLKWMTIKPGNKMGPFKQSGVRRGENNLNIYWKLLRADFTAGSIFLPLVTYER